MFKPNEDLLFGIVDKKVRELCRWDDKTLVIRRAPEPTDLFWENLSLDSWRRFKLTLYT